MAMEQELEAVVRLFPKRQAEISRLLRSDEAFAGICRDLADAQTAFARWSAEPDNDLNAKRVNEYQALVSELASEIEDLLDHPPG